MQRNLHGGCGCITPTQRNLSRVRVAKCVQPDAVHQRVLVRVKAEAEVDTESQASGSMTGKDPSAASAEEIELCRECEYYIERLYSRRDMRVKELQLVLGIEDPRAERRRTEMEVEQDTGVSRDEIVQALQDVSNGLVPRDYASLAQLADELRNWPYLDTEFEDEQASLDAAYEDVTDTGLDQSQKPAKRFRDAKTGDPRPPIGREGDESSRGPFDRLRDTFGYAYLYILSAVPVIIVAAVVTLLFRASLQ